MIKRRFSASIAVGLALASVGFTGAGACEYDSIPGYNHATGQIDANPYAGAYTEVAEKVARDQRAAAIEQARTAFVERFGLDDAEPVAAPATIVAVAMTAPDARPD